MREGLENMRKLVYAFYDQGFSFRKLTNKYPDLAGAITDCLSGDVNKDFSRLYAGVAETAEGESPGEGDAGSVTAPQRSSRHSLSQRGRLRSRRGPPRLPPSRLNSARRSQPPPVRV